MYISQKRSLIRAAARTAAALLAFILLCAAVPGAAAVVSDPTGQGIGVSAVLYDNSNGLPTSEANAIVQSSDGYIWIGSYSGLIRFDGNTFHRYDASSGVSSVVSLFADSRDRIWVGTNDSGVACLQDEQFTFYNRDEGLSSSSVHSITEDEDGNIILATTMGIAYIDSEGVLHPIDDAMINRQYVCELVNGPEGVIYGVTNSGDVFTVEQHRVSGYYGSAELGFGMVYTIQADMDNPGCVYLGMLESEIIYGDLSDGMKNARSISVEPLSTIKSIHLINGEVWVTADNGICYLPPSGGIVVLSDLPMTNSIDHMMVDYEGNLWFSSSRQGVMKIVENRFTDVSARAKLGAMVVNTTCRCGDDILIGTDTGLVVLGPDYQQVENDLTELMAGARIRCIRQDSRGDIWLCTYSSYGLVRYTPSTGEWFSYVKDTGLAANRARMMKELSDGSVAVATNAGVNIITDGRVTAVYDGANGISNLEILCIEQADDGSILAGSDGDGIYVINGSRVSRIGIEDGLRSEVILRLKNDPAVDGLCWIITSNSISYMKDGVITTLKNFPYSNNFDVFFDQLDRAWVISSNGIYVLKKSDLLADTPFAFTHYDTNSGLTRVATANSYSQLDEDGTLFMACSTGVVAYNINDTHDSDTDVRLAVPYMTVDDKYLGVHGSTEIHIPSDCRRLNIYANAFTYALYDPHVSYYLEGFDDAPIETTKQELTYASYTNLKGGTYRFHLNLLNTLTGDIDKELVITIIKEKAVYEQVWFQIAMVILGAGMLVGVTILANVKRNRALVKKQRETKALVNEMTSVFAECIDMKDAYTNGHSSRVAKYTAMMAEKLGKSKEEIEDIYNIALLHDIGKISIPDNILNKPGRLTDDEFVVMKSHSSRGYEILNKIPIAPQLALGAGYHHERYDGRGYPRGLSGDEIPEVASIIAVADTFDAMYSTRPYRKKMPLADVAAEIQRCSGTQLNPRVVEVFLQLVKEGAFDDEGSGAEQSPDGAAPAGQT